MELYEATQNEDSKKSKTTIRRIKEDYRPAKWEEVQVTECRTSC